MAVKKTRNRDQASRKIEDHIVEEANVKTDEGLLEAKKGEVHSTTRLEDDHGTGKKVIIRSFDFKANPEAFKHQTPSKQQLFDAHAEQIKVFLWKDGYSVMPEVKPRLMLSKNRHYYRILVGAEPRLGEYIAEHAPTLSQIAHGKQG